MKYFATFLLLTFLFLLPAFSQSEEALFAPDQIIVKFKKEIALEVAKQFSQTQFGLPAIDALNESYGLADIQLTGNKKTPTSYIIRYQTDQNILALVEKYQAMDLFTWVEPNFIGHGGGVKGMNSTLPDDVFFSRQWGLHNDGSFSLSPAIEDADIDMDLAWDLEQGRASVIVAILDSGAKLDHPELDGRIWNNTLEENNGVDSDANGYTDDVIGWDFANDDNDPTDTHGHGSNVAGIVGANADNGVGYAGVDWHCQLMIGQILEDNSGLYSWWAEAIHYAVDNGAKVINMSVGGSGFSNLLQEAVDYAYFNGSIVVACMMNTDSETTFYPAGFANSIAVGSTDANDNRSTPFFWSNTSGSNYGDHIDVVAPGNFIYGLDQNSNTNFNSYWGGTSQAAPLVTGLSALLLSQNSNYTADELRMIIRDTAEDGIGNTTEDTPGWDKYYGYGRINAHQAISQFLSNTEQLNRSSFSVHPNPVHANGQLFLHFQEVLSEEVEISLINSLGQTIVQSKISTATNNIQLSIPNCPAGIYHLQLETKDNMSTQAITVQQ